MILILLAFLNFGCFGNKNVKNNENKPEPVPFYEEEFIPEEDNSKAEGSLWGNGTKSLYSDNKARNVGEIVMIMIRENASAQQSASDSRSKNGSISGKAGTGILNFIPEMGAEGKSALGNSGTTKRSGNLSASVSARIEKKDKYGNLYLKGARNVLINNELQEIEISGFVRPSDISVSNTIESSYLADAQVKYNGKLVFDGKAKPGLISDVLSSIVGFFF